ncbi:hypothetical protein RRF57_003904 [Xylaria bambusicola]|uniref:Prefoldin subunit 5 n=1 Tax=Xylaria bambusicola TaxID=326684 RepID=A0AAN7UVC4_9PEZI
MSLPSTLRIMAAEAGEAGPVNLDTLSVQQLTQVKNQLDQELEHLTSSFTQLQAAQAKFRDCLRCVQGENKPVLVPLTNSLYVSGTLASASHVIVDVGTGFYVEKVRWISSTSSLLHDLMYNYSQSIKSAAEFYENKMTEVGVNIKELEGIVQSKTNNIRVIEQGSSYNQGVSLLVLCRASRKLTRRQQNSVKTENGIEPAAIDYQCSKAVTQLFLPK